MKTAINCMVKNEEILLDNVLPIWKNYPIDLFIFYDDNSTDSTIQVIKNHLDNEKIIIINDKLNKFNEGFQRQRMIDISKKHKVDYIVSLDSDELMTSNFIKDFNMYLNLFQSSDVWLYWYNCVNSLEYYRTDNAYTNNYRSFVLPTSKISNMDISAWKYHTPRTPTVNLPKLQTKDIGIIHLQSCNRKFYALKQLWYKHYELVNYNHSIQTINQRYDSVVNNLNFSPQKMNDSLINGINIDLSFFDSLAEKKGYVEFIKKHYNKNLVTFGEEYL